MSRRPVRGRATAGLLAGAALGLAAGVAQAELIDIQWPDDNRFERRLTLLPGKFAELCGPLQAGQTVEWSFEADQALDFNIHYHVGSDVRYPARQDRVARLQGQLAVDSPQDHCWMWVNKTEAAATLAVSLARR
ncbi:hypothetical protein [Ideonella sp. A 288]|uniref:hypothetical protein n=1 Tax=Ideonella sp. A 288 TaxID=1962181 RepID=UPI000B4AC47E|nr:hypothetical protein [Ideonella sp. A 288]